MDNADSSAPIQWLTPKHSPAARTPRRSARSVCRTGWERRQRRWQRACATSTNAGDAYKNDAESRITDGQDRSSQRRQQAAPLPSQQQVLLATMEAHGGSTRQADTQRSVQLLQECNRLLRKKGPRLRQREELRRMAVVRPCDHAYNAHNRHCRHFSCTALHGAVLLGTAGTHRSNWRSAGCGGIGCLM